MLKLAIADDQSLFRKGIKMIIDSIPDFTVVMEAANGKDLLDKLSVCEDFPSILLLDLKMPGLDGIETAKLLQKNYPSLKIIILTVHAEERFISNLFECGVHSYLFKDVEAEELERAIRTVNADGFYFNAIIMNALRKRSGSKRQILTLDESPVDLTEREKEVLKLICEEFTAAEIADKLSLSVRTVEGYRNNLLLKTGSKNTAGLVIYAIKYNLAGRMI